MPLRIRKRYRPTDTVSATDAMEYLKIARPTFYRHVRLGHIKPAGTSGLRKVYRISDLDKLKEIVEITAAHSPTGITSTDKLYEGMSDEQAVASANSGFQRQHQEILAKFKTSINKLLPENQDLLRATLLHVGMERGVVEKFFAMMENGTPAAQMRAIEEWFSQVLPRQQNTKKEVNPGAEWLRVIDTMQNIQHSIVNSLHGPLAEITDESNIVEAEFLEEIEAPPLILPGEKQ